MFFAHALEILLNSVVEDLPASREGDANDPELQKKQITLMNTVDFLDYFDHALDVVVGCARKIEVTHWPRLFDVVGNPKTLFEVSYLLLADVISSIDSWLVIGLHYIWTIEDGWVVSFSPS